MMSNVYLMTSRVDLVTSRVNLVTSRVNLVTSRVNLVTSRDTLVLLHIVRPLSVSFHLQNGACSFNRLEVIGEEEL